MSLKDEFVEAARSYVGVPYHHQGRNRTRGLDCAGLLVVALQDLGFDIKDIEGYPRLPNSESLRKIVEENLGNPKPISTMGKGDVLLMRFSEQPQHLAVHAGDTIIHAYSKKKQVVEHRFADIWQKRVVGVYSIV